MRPFMFNRAMFVGLVLLAPIALGAAVPVLKSRVTAHKVSAAKPAKAAPGLARTTVTKPAPGNAVTSKAVAAGTPSVAKAGKKPAPKTLADRVMNPLKFRGQARLAYQIARTHANTFNRLFCYCGCDNELKHKTLLSCYFGDHSMWCGTCRDEAFVAARLEDKGASLSDIQKEVDREFRNRYPYTRKGSNAYRAYLASREYKTNSKY